MLHPFPPFIVALYFGSIKPNEADAFIPDFMEEYKMLHSVGFEQANQAFTVTLNEGICDAPSHQFLKAIRIHHTRYARDNYVVEGEYFENRMAY